MGQNDIQRGGLNSVLRRTLNVKGDLPPAPVVGAEIIPTFPLEVDRVEWGYLKGERQGFLEINSTPTPANLGIGLLEVPTISDLMVIVTKVTVQYGVGQAGGAFNLRMGQPAQGLGVLIPTGIVAVPAWARDVRWSNDGNNLPQPAARGWTGSTLLPTGNFIVDMDVPVNEYRDLLLRTGPWVLMPGWKLFGIATLAGAAICVAFSWYERTLEPNEKGVGLTGTL